jgi:hypothetical protein
VSSILDALKKLEKDKAAQNPEAGQEENLGFTWPVPIDSKEAHSKRLGKKIGIAPLIGVFILTFLVGGGVLLFWDFFRAETSDNIKKTATGDPIMEKYPPPISPASENGSVQGGPPNLAPNPKATAETGASSSQYRHESEREWPGKGDESADDTYGTDKVGNGKDSRMEVISPTLDKETNEMIARIPKDMLPPKKVADSKWLTLQGISWSKNPQERVAVINSQIVKEGRKVDNALVMRIEKDYVVVEKDGEKFMVPFNHH